MQQRAIQRLGRAVSVVGLGTWQLGAEWGTVTEDQARAVLRAAVDHGVTFFDANFFHRAGRRSGHFDRSLVGIEIEHRLVCGHGVADGDQNFHHGS